MTVSKILSEQYIQPYKKEKKMAEIIEKGINHSTPGWYLNAKGIKLFLTEDAGMHAPVEFFTDTDKSVSPYALTPWQDERPDLSFCPLLQNLRGDFFCMPFGGNPEGVDGFEYPPHGETAASAWKLDKAVEEGEKAVFEFSMDTTINPFHIVKHFEMRSNHSALYIKHTVSGLDGKMPYGHHSIIHMPEEGEKMYLSTSKFDVGMTCPGVFSDPKNLEHQYLASGERFDSLEKVPTAFKADPVHDYTTYPSPIGYADLFSMLSKPGKTPAWTACVYPERGYIFFMLRNPETLPATTIWTSNSGRYGFPWNGNTRCLGVEDNCSFFANGIKDSTEENCLSKEGWTTCGTFSKAAPKEICHIQGVARISADFGRVVSAEFADGKVIFKDAAGKTASANVDISFLGY